MDVGVVAADNVTGGHVDDVLTLVGEKASDLLPFEAEGGPAGKEDAILGRSRQPRCFGVISALGSIRMGFNLDLAGFALLRTTTSLLQDEGGSDHGPLRVAQDALPSDWLACCFP